MKYKPKAYATALAESLSGKGVDGKKVTANFLGLLQKNGDMKKSREILALVERLLLKKTGNKKVTLQTARPTDVKSIVKAFVKKGDELEKKINPGLVAGVKIIVDDNRQLDLSLAKKLENMF